MLLVHRHLSGRPRFYVTVLLGAVAVFYASTDAARSGHQKHAPFVLPFSFKMRSSARQVYRWVALSRWTAPESPQG